ncbi:hypothetical protein [Cerasicoccus maritimus]|uniref:hypothetical protein n=1 Tax=Cerasicoccus maritimus TaxID=490089 RepID=UPI002852B088|nr:hypothetical protein [Cerasicoccus maritimus]
MKTKILLLAFALCGAINVNAQHDHDHDHDHDHGDHGHGDHGHSHEQAKAGPNGGKVVEATEPHFELFIQDDRKVRVTFLNDELKPMAHDGATVSAIGGDRSKPARLSFEQVAGAYVSTEPMPDGANVPLILRVKPDQKSKTATARININLAQCPTCDFKEYACICGH